MESTLFESLIDLNKSFQKIMPLAAIWLSKPVAISDKDKCHRITARITVGDKIRLDKGWIENISNENTATHEVLGCYGNISNTVLYFDLKDLETNELFTLKIK